MYIESLPTEFAKVFSANVIVPVATPAAPTVAPQGATGAVTYSYRITATNANGETLAGTAGTTATGNAALSGANFNRLTWAAVAGATGYKVYGRTGASELLMATLGNVLTFDDTGAVTPAGALPAANTTGNPKRLVTTVEPVVGNGILNAAHYDRVILALFGARTVDNQTVTARVTGWRKAGTVWVPQTLAILTGTLGLLTGAAGQTVESTDFLADTITQTAVHPDTKLLSPADDTLALATVPLLGSRYVDVQVAVGTASSANALAAMALGDGR